MAITLSSASLTPQDDQGKYVRDKCIEECNYLLRRLKKGTYNIRWNGFYPLRKNQTKPNAEQNLKIVVESSLEYGKFIYPRKPYLTKTIKIGGRKASCIRLWQLEQLEELCHKLTQLAASEVDESP
jgi:hypothetical protein